MSLVEAKIGFPRGVPNTGPGRGVAGQFLNVFFRA